MNISLWVQSIIDMIKLLFQMIVVIGISSILITSIVIIFAYVMNFYLEKHNYILNNYNMSIKKYWKIKIYFLISNILTIFFLIHLVYWVFNDSIFNSSIILLDTITLITILSVDNFISWTLFKKLNKIKLHYLIEKVIVKLIKKEIDEFINNNKNITISNNKEKIEDCYFQNELSKLVNDFEEKLYIEFNNLTKLNKLDKFFKTYIDVNYFVTIQCFDNNLKSKMKEKLEEYCVKNNLLK